MKLRRVFPLVIAFVFVPAALMLTASILILVFGIWLGWLPVHAIFTDLAGTIRIA